MSNPPYYSPLASRADSPPPTKTLLSDFPMDQKNSAGLPPASMAPSSQTSAPVVGGGSGRPHFITTSFGNTSGFGQGQQQQPQQPQQQQQQQQQQPLQAGNVPVIYATSTTGTTTQQQHGGGSEGGQGEPTRCQRFRTTASTSGFCPSPSYAPGLGQSLGKGKPSPAVVSAYNVIPVPLVGRWPAMVHCPACDGLGLTRVGYRVGVGAHAMAGVLLLTTGIGVVLPYVLPQCKDVEHTCGGCESLLATSYFLGGTEAHMF